MSGIDRQTFRPIANLASAYQGVEVIVTTLIGDRVMRREFGGGILELLGRLVTPPLFAAFQQIIATAIDLWEPRFRVRRITPEGSVEQIRLGHLGLIIEVDYRPQGHLGDFTVERTLSFTMLFRESRISIST